MSVKADIKIIMTEESFIELDKKIRTFGFEDWELDLWRNRREERNIRKFGQTFILLSWNYVKWDYDTDDVVAMIYDYLTMLKLNNIPCRYIAIYDVGIQEEIKSVGQEPEMIGFIESCMWIKQEIAISDYIYQYED